MTQQQHETRIGADGLPDSATDMSGILELELEPGQKLTEEQKQRLRETVTRNVRSAPPETQARVLDKMETFLRAFGDLPAEKLALWSIANTLKAMHAKLEMLRPCLVNHAKGLDEGKTVFHMGSVYGQVLLAHAALGSAAEELEHAATCECMNHDQGDEHPTDAPPAETV